MMNFTPREISTQSLISLLEALQEQPSAEHHQAMLGYLCSQDSLCKYSDSSRGITACSLNTLKKSCSVVPGGFSALNLSRRRALSALNDVRSVQSSDGDTSKRVLQKRVEKLNLQLQAATEDLLLMTRLLERSMRYGRQYTADAGITGLIERCASDQAEIRDMLSLRQTSSLQLRVVERPK